MKFCTFPTGSLTGYQAEEISTSLSSSPPQETVGNNEVVTKRSGSIKKNCWKGLNVY